MTEKGEMRILAVPILEESSWTRVQRPRFIGETLGASPSWKADQDSCRKYPGLGDQRRPERTPQLYPRPHG